MEVSTATISACTAKSLIVSRGSPMQSLNDELVAVEDSIDVGNVLWILYDCLYINHCRYLAIFQCPCDVYLNKQGMEFCKGVMERCVKIF